MYRCHVASSGTAASGECSLPSPAALAPVVLPSLRLHPEFYALSSDCAVAGYFSAVSAHVS